MTALKSIGIYPAQSKEIPQSKIRLSLADNLSFCRMRSKQNVIFFLRCAHSNYLLAKIPYSITTSLLLNALVLISIHC
jgi:hypothetical protein